MSKQIVNKQGAASNYRKTVVIDTGVFKGLSCAVTGSKRFVFKPGAVIVDEAGEQRQSRANPVFAITDSEFTVLKWVGPDAEKAAKKYAA